VQADARIFPAVVEDGMRHLAEVLDAARVIPRPNSRSPLMRFQG